MKVLVTGATGFIGSHLVERLLERGDEVTAFVRASADATRLVTKGVNIVVGDVREERDVERAAKGSRLVYHLARAKAHGTRPMSEVRAVNVDGTANVARAATRSGVERIVYSSSAAVYGSRVRRKPVAEDDLPNPDSPYARSKAMSEDALREHAGVPLVIARVTAVLGPGSRSWLPILRSVAARRLRLIGNGTNWHHPADVSDIVDGLILCGTEAVAAGRIYNLAGGEPITVGDMIGLVAAELQIEGDPPSAVPAAPFDLYLWVNRIADRVAGVRLPRVDSVAFLTSDRILDLSRAENELGYTPRVGVRQAVARTAEWCRSEGLL